MTRPTTMPVISRATSKIAVPATARRATSPSGSATDARRPAIPASAARVIRVLCVDDHAVLIEGLKAHFAIDGRIEIVGQSSTAARLVDQVERHRPDVVLLDIEMPGPDAFESADRVRQAFPDVRVMVLSAHVRDGYVTAAFAAGVSAYFVKSDELADIVAGIEGIVKKGGRTFLASPKVLERCRPITAKRTHSRTMTKGRREPDGAESAPRTLLTSLSPREAGILRLIGKGLPRTQIAAQLSRSVKTIDGHQDRLMRKLGIATRADLMRFAIREGLAQA